VATDALGHLLAESAAAAALTAAVRSGVPDLPGPLRFVTQAADDDSRPDVVGRDTQREVLHIEGKFWAPLTAAQAEDKYLQRLTSQHVGGGTTDTCRGVLLWICPPRRVEVLWREACHVSSASPRPTTGRWRFADTSSGQVVALTDWLTICDSLERAGSESLGEDVRQLRALIDEVDRHGFTPWTVSDLTDQHTARQWVAMLGIAETIRTQAQAVRIAERATKRNTTAHGRMWRGPTMRLAGVYTALIVSPPLFAQHGTSPLWLRWWRGPADVARRAFPGLTVETGNGCALPVPVAAGSLEVDVVSEALRFLDSCRDKLSRAIVPTDDLDLLEADDEE
jgi:hypothetical protein